MHTHTNVRARAALQTILVLLLLLPCSAAYCVDQQEAEPAEKMQATLMPPSRDWNIQLSLGYLPSADLRGVNGSVEIGDYRFRLNRNFKLDTKTTLSIGAAYGLKHIEATAAAGLPQDLHALSLETSINYRINEHSFASLRLSPGLFSDFGNIGSDDVKMPVLAMAGYSFDNGLTLVGGFVYRVGHHSAPFLPVAGLTYQPNQYWRFDLVAPRPGVTYIPSRQVRLFAAGDFASDEYELKDRSSGAKALKYRDYKVMFGAEYLLTPVIKLTGTAGYAFDRSFEFYDGTRGNIRIDNVPFIKFSLDVGW